MRHIISIQDLGREEIGRILDHAAAIQSRSYDPSALEGKLLGLLFFEPSTRTRMSFAAAMARLGGDFLSMDSVEASSMAKGETLADTIRVVSGYVDAIVLRHPREGAARLASEFAHVPVINAGDGAGQHPSQTLLDLFTIRQSMPLEKIHVGLLGDLRYGRTAHSLAHALSLYNVTIHAITPKGLELPAVSRQSSAMPGPRSSSTGTSHRASANSTCSTSRGSRGSGSRTPPPTSRSHRATG